MCGGGGGGGGKLEGTFFGLVCENHTLLGGFGACPAKKKEEKIIALRLSFDS